MQFCTGTDRVQSDSNYLSLLLYPFDAKLLSSTRREFEREHILPIFFTPKQANDTLPEMRGIVERIIAIKKDADSKTDDEAITRTMEGLEKEIQKLEDLGCVLKDMNTGLIDFPAVRLGTRVWLCWKLGEEAVTFWHGLNEGFAGRKSVDEQEFYEDDVAIKSLTSSLSSRLHA
jgi:hypothetical protein